MSDDTGLLRNPRTSAIVRIIADRGIEPQPRVLVVGCGDGREAAVLARDLGGSVTGIDIVEKFDPAATRLAQLQRGDAMALAFDDASFDVVYSYHALEHIADPGAALAEMNRVLKPGGTCCIGTPNRTRLVGYIGGGSTWRQKIRWNLTDWRARLTGRFRNECGAHAGYTSQELHDLMLGHFASTEEVTAQYYRILYARHPLAIRILVDSGLGTVLFPSIYFAGTR